MLTARLRSMCPSRMLPSQWILTHLNMPLRAPAARRQCAVENAENRDKRHGTGTGSVAGEFFRVFTQAIMC
jgi:hypothetical protein